MKRGLTTTSGGAHAKAVRHMPIPVTHSGLQLFEAPRVLTPFDRGFTEEIFPKTNLNGPTLEFELSGERNVYVDLINIYLQLKISLLSYDHAHATDKSFKIITDAAADPGCVANNILHSIFSNCDVSLQGVQISTANNLYGHKAYIETELSHPTECKETWLAAQGYQYEKNPGASANTAMVARRAKNIAEEWNNFYGRLAIDFFSAEKYLIPGVAVRIKLVRAPAEFDVVVLPKEKAVAASRYQIKIDHASLFVHKIEVAGDEYARLERELSLRPAFYEYLEVIPKTYLIPKGHNLMIEEDIFNAAPIRRLVIAMNTNQNFTGTLGSNPFHYRKFGLKRVLLYREGSPVGGTPLVVTNNTRAYYNTIKALHAVHAGNGIKLDEFDNHFILVFMLTADLDSRDETTRPELTGGRLRLHLEFDTALAEPLEVLLLGERKSAVYIDKNRAVLKNALFSS